MQRRMSGIGFEELIAAISELANFSGQAAVRSPEPRDWPDASQFRGSARTVIQQGLTRQRVQAARRHVFLEFAIPRSRVEFREPLAKFGKFSLGQPSNRAGDLCNGRHEKSLLRPCGRINVDQDFVRLTPALSRGTHITVRRRLQRVVRPPAKSYASKKSLRNEMRDGRREGRSYNQQYRSPQAPRRVEAGELNEEVCQVHRTVCDIGEDGQNE